MKLSEALRALNASVSEAPEALEYLKNKGVIIPEDLEYHLSWNELYQLHPSLLSMEKELWKKNNGPQSVLPEELSVGVKTIGVVNKLTENGCFCNLPNSKFGFMPKTLSYGLITESGKLLFSKGESIEVIVHSISKKGLILLSSVWHYEKVQEKERIINEEKRLKLEEKKVKIEKRELFVKNFEPGVVLEAEVTKIYNCEAHIKVGDCEGIIPKEEIDWNGINRLEDIIYEGEKINAVFLKYDEAQKKLFFGLKYLKEKPYEESYYDLDLQQLLKFMGFQSDSFIGVARNYGKHTFLENLYSSDESTMGKLLIDPIYGYNLNALIIGKDIVVENGKYYKTKIKLNYKDKRLQKNQLFHFLCSNIEEVENPYKLDVKKAFKKRTADPSANSTIAGLLKTVSKDMYSSKDRMFFELIQNADDAAASKGVLIDVSTIGDYLVVCHNGYSFDKDDFEAITTAANGTKKANENKTGYKGIGFKSVFTDSEKVFISTGGYKFVFNREDEIFQDFDRFYLDNNPFINDPKSKQNFLNIYDLERRKFDKVNSIPWQLEPIWVEDFPQELGLDFSKHNVSIALKIGEYKLSGEDGYIAAIDKILDNPNFMIFLRNTNRIDFNDRSISKSLENNIITLKNSFNDKRIERFERIDYEIPVTNESFEKTGVDIRIVIEKQDDTDGKITEAKFVDLKNQVIENIPKKIAITNATTISFAVPINEDGTLNPICDRTEISMFAFLPTLVKDFRFPFYVNANFILDPPRQRILGDNPWNYYLMQEIARNIVLWCATLSSRGDPNALNILLPDYFEDESSDIRRLAEHFNSTYQRFLESEAFILNHKGELSKQNEIIIDNTGLVEIVGAQLFCEIIGTDKFVPMPGINSAILSRRKVFKQIENIDLSFVSTKLRGSTALNNWLSFATPERLSLFFDWLKKNKENCADVINLLPIFKFEDGCKSRNEIQEDTSRIITTKNISPIREILSRLGFYCSDGIFNDHPIYELIDVQDEKDIFKRISEKLPNDILSREDKLNLVKTLVEFSGVGESMTSQLLLFHNEQGTIKPLAEMTRYKEGYPTWLNPYILKQDEFEEELTKFLIEESAVFSKIITEHFSEINIPPYAIYQQFKEDWSGQFTRKVIDKTGPSESLISIIEESDLETQKYFLSKISRIDLIDDSKYGKDSFIYRILRIALSIPDAPSTVSDKIFFDGQCIKDFSIKDSVNCEYTNNGENKKITFSLAKLLPNYRDKSGQIEKVLALFDTKKGLEKFFDAKSKPLDELYNELNTSLGIPHAMYNPWKPNLGNAQQYLFSVWRRKQSWSTLRGMQIQLEKESDVFIFDLMNILFDNNIDISTSPFTCHLKDYFSGKFFKCDYVFNEECVLGTIEKWADTKEKEDYLIRNGVKDISCDAIKYRQLFLEDQSIDGLKPLSEKELKSALSFISELSGCQRPFNGKSQKDILMELRENKKLNLSEKCNLDELCSISQEWNGKEYNEWISGNHPQILFFDGELPMNLFFNNTLLIQFNEGIHYFDSSHNKLYVSRDVEIESSLFSIAREGKSALDLDDYKYLCMSGKITISKDEIESKDKQISSLKKDNQAKEELLNRYREKYGNLDDDNKEIPQEFVSDAITITKGETSSMSKDKQYDAQIEAQKFLMQVMKDWTFPNGYGEYDEMGKPNHFSTVKVVNEKGETVPIVLKSYKIVDEPFKINTEEWDWIIQYDAYLLIYDGHDIKKHNINDLVRNQSNVSITFSTENLDIEERISAFSESLHYFKELHFDFDSFNISKKAQSVKDIYYTNIGIQNNLSDEDL